MALTTTPLKHNRRAMTLVELLVAIAMIGALVALTLPAVQAARESARRMNCASNLRQVGFALQTYHDAYGVFPALATHQGNGVGNLSFLVRLLPFIEQGALAHQVHWDESFDSKHHQRTLNPVRPKLYLCPSGSVTTAERGEGCTAHYYGVLGPKAAGYGLEIRPSGANGGRATDGPLQVNRTLNLAAIVDGTSNTLLVGEVSWNKAGCYRPWTRGAEIAAANPGKNVTFGLRKQAYTFENLNDVSFGAEHYSGCNFVRADGSTLFLHDGVEQTMFQALASRNGNEVIQLP